MTRINIAGIAVNADKHFLLDLQIMLSKRHGELGAEIGRCMDMGKASTLAAELLKLQAAYNAIDTMYAEMNDPSELHIQDI